MASFSVIEGHISVPVKYMPFEDAAPEAATDETVQLSYSAWVPAGGAASAGGRGPRTVILFCHGAFSSRSDAKSTGQALAPQGIAVYAHDQRGWGRDWSGTKGFVRSRRDYIGDVATFARVISNLHAERDGQAPRIFLAGHSMGGLIALATALTFPRTFVGCIGIAPWLDTNAPVPVVLRALAPVLNCMAPKMSSKAEQPSSDFTNDPKEAARADEEERTGIRYKRGTIRWFVECEKLQKQVREGAGRLSMPLFLAIAEQDVSVSNPAIEALAKAAPKGATLRKYAGKHDLGYEVAEVRAALFADVSAFIQASLPGAAPSSASAPATDTGAVLPATNAI
eukprot:tig00000093_g3524.t1